MADKLQIQSSATDNESVDDFGREHSEKLQGLARAVISSLYMLIRSVKMYEPDNAVFVFSAGRQHQHREASFPAHPPQNLEPVEPREHNVQHHQVITAVQRGRNADDCRRVARKLEAI